MNPHVPGGVQEPENVPPAQFVNPPPTEVVPVPPYVDPQAFGRVAPGRRSWAFLAAVGVLLAAVLAVEIRQRALDVAGAPSAAAAPAPSFEGRIGVDSHFIWSDEAEAQHELAVARSGGVTWIREDFPWSSLEPERGVFNWRRADNLMTAASRAGVHVLPILDYSPKWASSDPSGAGDPTYPPRRPEDYAAFAAAVVARYGPQGAFWASDSSLRRDPVQDVELWNEPWGHWAWKPDPDPVGYDRLVRAAAPAIRSVAPHTRILISGDLFEVRTDRKPTAWLALLLNADPDISRLVDAYSVHPYPGNRTASPDDTSVSEFSFNRVELIHRLLVERGAEHPLWLTEVGWSTGGSRSDAVSERQQAEYLSTAVRRALIDWGGYVGKIFAYDFARSTGKPDDLEGNYGLLRADGSAKPAWTRLSQLIVSEQAKRMVDLLARGARTPHLRRRIAP